MFKNHEVRTTIVKKNKNSGSADAEQKPFMTPDEIHTMTDAIMKKAAVTVVAVAGALTIIHTVSEVVINNTNPAYKKK